MKGIPFPHISDIWHQPLDTAGRQTISTHLWRLISVLVYSWRAYHFHTSVTSYISPWIQLGGIPFPYICDILYQPLNTAGAYHFRTFVTSYTSPWIQLRGIPFPYVCDILYQPLNTDGGIPFPYVCDILLHLWYLIPILEYSWGHTISIRLWHLISALENSWRANHFHTFVTSYISPRIQLGAYHFHTSYISLWI